MLKCCLHIVWQFHYLWKNKYFSWDFLKLGHVDSLESKMSYWALWLLLCPRESKLKYTESWIFTPRLEAVNKHYISVHEQNEHIIVSLFKRQNLWWENANRQSRAFPGDNANGLAGMPPRDMTHSCSPEYHKMVEHVCCLHVLLVVEEMPQAN